MNVTGQWKNPHELALDSEKGNVLTEPFQEEEGAGDDVYHLSKQ